MGRIHGLAGDAVSRAVDDWLDRLGAADYAGSPLRTLSKGMCQKVAIAQALLGRPGLLVLDLSGVPGQPSVTSASVA